MLGLQSIVDQKEMRDSQLIKIYKIVLQCCDEYFIKNKCKAAGQNVDNGRDEQIDSILYFVNYLLVTQNIKDEWVCINMEDNGISPEQTIELVDHAIDLFFSSDFQGESLSQDDFKNHHKNVLNIIISEPIINQNKSVTYF